MLKSKNKLIAITMGEPAGIGPEVIAKALSKAALRRLARFMIIGDWNVFRLYCPRLPGNVSFLDMKNFPAGKIRLGHPHPLTARASLQYIDKALELIAQKKMNALVTAPVSKKAVSSLNKKFPGHTEYIAHYFHIRRFAMMFVGPTLKTVVATRHIPLQQVPQAVTSQHLYETILLTECALKEYFKIKHPKIAVCGINPHAGEGGTIGKEEIRTLIPVIRKAQKNHLKVFGPFSADTIYYSANAKKYDVIIAMYHDQGLIPIKTLFFNRLVNLTIGLPFVRTSPAHGTAFDIAGQNKADPTSMAEAIKLAAELI